MTMCKILFDNILNKYHIRVLNDEGTWLERYISIYDHSPMYWDTFISAYNFASLQNYNVSIPNLLDYTDTTRYQSDYLIYNELTQ